MSFLLRSIFFLSFCFTFFICSLTDTAPTLHFNLAREKLLLGFSFATHNECKAATDKKAEWIQRAEVAWAELAQPYQGKHHLQHQCQAH